MLEVIIRPRAQLDLESIYIHIAVVLGAPSAAHSTLDALFQAIERVADLPDLGSIFESERLTRTYRRTLARNYWIYYSVEDSHLVVWRVFHTRQDVSDSTLIDL